MEKILITGGCSGIGLETVKILLEKTNYHLLISYNKTKAPKEIIENKRIEIIKADLSTFGGGELLASKVIEENHDIKGICLCHGMNKPSGIEDTNESDFNLIINNNLSSIYGFFSLLVGKLKNLKSVVLISSFCGLVGGPKTAHYAISKAGLDTLALNLSRRLGETGTRVNSVAPGYILTRMLPNGIDKKTTELISLRRAGEPSEIAKVINFLLSSDSSYITGQCIKVDGGLRI